MSANVGCIFPVGSFLLPHSKRQDGAGSILFGLDGREGKTPFSETIYLTDAFRWLLVDMWGATL